MPINTNNYSDTKGVQAHLGFLLLIVLDLLSKDSISQMQELSMIFISVAIPTLVITLTVLPMDIENFPNFQMALAFVSHTLGHVAGIIALTIIFYDFNALAGVLFACASFAAFIAFSYVIYMPHKKQIDAFVEEMFTGEKDA